MAVKTTCPAPVHPLPVFIEHGTADTIVPYAGGQVGNWFLRGRGTTLGTERTVAIWRQLAGLPDTPAVYRFPHLHPDDPTSATRYVWGTDPARVQVEFLKIEGGGHVEADRNNALPWLLRKLAGEMNHDVDTADEAWSFFKTKHKAATANPSP
jgi:polyhydroxybutyrate depolymerase